MSERLISVSSSFGEELLLQSMVGWERLSKPFEYRLSLLSTNGELAFEDVLGTEMVVSLTVHNNETRYFHGLVTEFSQRPVDAGHYAGYVAVVRPSLWLLTRTADCRIFQNRTIPEIVKTILKEHGISAQFKLMGKYPERAYCVQYRETDFNFISRLMEDEGIYYYFQHTDSKHTLRAVDDMSLHLPSVGYETVPYFPPANESRRERDHLSEWRRVQRVQPTAYALNDYNFITPRTRLLSDHAMSRSHEGTGYEIYDYPGEYEKGEDGKRLAQIRLEELQADYERIDARGNARGLGVGETFALERHPRPDENVEVLVVGASYTMSTDAYETSGRDEESLTFEASLEVMKTAEIFRPTRSTPKPLVQGPQTAVVVGSAKEEIETDQYGRVRVQFHWDRYGERNENSSCLIRVAQTWAGKGFGTMHVPRIGQEVIVEFLEGDPDRPIITGRVYNEDNMPPWELPANMTQSGIQTRSSKKGTADNANIIRFEDLKGEEQLFIHAEKNQDIEVENDETHWVGNDRTKTVDNNETVQVKGNRTETVGKNETITVQGARTEKVAKSETISIGESRTEGVKANESIQIGEKRSLQVGKTSTVSVGDNLEVTVGKDQVVSVGGDHKIEVAKAETTSVGKDRSADVGKNDAITVGKKFTVEAGDEITLKTGKASIVLKKDGTITINGKDVTVEGSGKITLDASGDLILKGKTIKEN